MLPNDDFSILELLLQQQSDDGRVLLLADEGNVRLLRDLVLGFWKEQVNEFGENIKKGEKSEKGRNLLLSEISIGDQKLTAKVLGRAIEVVERYVKD